MRAAVLIALAVTACAPRGPQLIAEGLDEMEAMVVIVERGAELRAFAHPFRSARVGLPVDTAGADRVTTLFYAADLESRGLTAGELALAPSGRELPAHERAFVLELGAEEPAWTAVDELRPALRALRLATTGSECDVEPITQELDLTATATGVQLSFVVPGEPGAAIAGTTEGRIFRVTRDGVTEYGALTEPFHPGGAWLEPGTARLWAVRGLALVRVELGAERSTVTLVQDQLPDFIARMVGPTTAAEPFELFMTGQRGALLHFDGVTARELGRVAGEVKNLHVERTGPGRALMSNTATTIAALTSTTLGPLEEPFREEDCRNEFDDRFVPRIVYITTWKGEPALLRICWTGALVSRMYTRGPGGSGDWTPLPGALATIEEVRSAAPLLGGLLLGTGDSFVGRLTDAGQFCDPLEYGSPTATTRQNPYHFRFAVSLDPNTVALAGPRVREDPRAPPRVVLLRFP